MSVCPAVCFVLKKNNFSDYINQKPFLYVAKNITNCRYSSPLHGQAKLYKLIMRGRGYFQLPNKNNHLPLKTKNELPISRTLEPLGASNNILNYLWLSYLFSTIDTSIWGIQIRYLYIKKWMATSIKAKLKNQTLELTNVNSCVRIKKTNRILIYLSLNKIKHKFVAKLIKYRILIIEKLCLKHWNLLSSYWKKS